MAHEKVKQKSSITARGNTSQLAMSEKESPADEKEIFCHRMDVLDIDKN